MGMSAGGGGSSVKAEPNVTPMIDVMLVLLIIFMLVVPALVSGMNAVPPEGVNLKPHPPEDEDQLLGIDGSGQYFLNKQPIRNETLGQALKNIYDVRTVDKILYVKADRNLPYEKVLDVLDIAAKNGVRMSAMITEQRPGTESAIASDNITPGGAKTGGGNP